VIRLQKDDLLRCVKRLDPRLRGRLQAQGPKLFVAGGYVRDCVTGEDPQDVDVMCTDAVTSREEAYWLGHQVLGESSIFSLQPENVRESQNAFTITGLEPPVQFIHRWTFAEPGDAVDSFDFTVAKAAFWWDGAKWASYCDKAFYPDLAARRLVYTSPERVEEVGGSLLRVVKFCRRGYRISPEDLGAVCARLVCGVDAGVINSERDMARCLTDLLREVDPLLDLDGVMSDESEEFE